MALLSASSVAAWVCLPPALGPSMLSLEWSLPSLFSLGRVYRGVEVLGWSFQSHKVEQCFSTTGLCGLLKYARVYS